MARTIIDPELEAIKAGDEVTFEAIVTRYHGSLMRLAMAYVRDHGVAEDVVQETWLTCLRTLDRFEGRSSLKTWIFGILMNVARARRRKESRVLPFASLFRRDDSDSRQPTIDPHRFGSNGLWTTPPDSWSNLPEERVISREALDRVKVAIEALPDKQREVVILRDIAGLDSAEVCELLAISATNQRVRLHRGRAAVRGVLEVPEMKCREVVELMTEYVEGTLSPANRARFEEHIAGCDGCTAYLEQLRATTRVLGKLADDPIPEPVKAELLKAFKNWKLA